ncbi:MAG: hypothetical protein JRI56_04650 [Deltaproteobacteria bacterium]|nr:hypothetical protein [Deltaproteobacteria bacterium]
MNKNDLLDRLIDIFNALNNLYNKNHEYEDEKFIKRIINWGNIEKEDEDKLDYFFVMNQCYGPWRDERQKEVWDHVYKPFKVKYNGDLRNIKNSFSYFPFKWQEDRIIKLSKYLNNKNLSFMEFLESIKNLDGLKTRNEFKKILNAKNTKTISTFIRDSLKKDVFPIDTRVQQILTYLGLPQDEDMMVYLSRKVQINPRIFERMIYNHYGNLCEKNNCKNCIIKVHCFFPLYLESLFTIKIE